MGGAGILAVVTLLIGIVLMILKSKSAEDNTRDERYLYNSLRANRGAVWILLLALILSPVLWNVVVMRSWGDQTADYWLSFADVQALAIIAVMFLLGVYLVADYVIFKLLDKRS